MLVLILALAVLITLASAVAVLRSRRFQRYLARKVILQYLNQPRGDRGQM